MPIYTNHFTIATLLSKLSTPELEVGVEMSFATSVLLGHTINPQIKHYHQLQITRFWKSLPKIKL